jgi:class 3 adenylate cyclase
VAAFDNCGSTSRLGDARLRVVLAALRSAWERVSALGITDQPPGERRRIRLTNQSAVIGTVSCGSFAVAYAVAGWRYAAPMAANVVTVLVLLGALWLSKRGARTLSRVAVLLPVNLVVVVASMLLGGRVGFIYYFFLFAAVAFLLFAEDQWPLKWAFALLSMACAVFVRVFAPGDAELGRAIGPVATAILDLASALAVMGTAMFIVHLFTRDTALAEARLSEEYARSERLLLNILPAPISARLKEGGQSIADGFAEVTVLFADLVGFTELGERLRPGDLVALLNRVFSVFDDLAEELGLEKIKTIGDCYMVAAGLPEAHHDHTAAVARMALRMRDALERINKDTGHTLHLRIGIHTGPVVAGVIGKRKFIYDLWGDTVNTASRMESTGIPDHIQVTREVFQRLHGGFEMEVRGTIPIKGKGEMETFLLKGEIGGDRAIV